MHNCHIYCDDCIQGAQKYIDNDYVDLGIDDPPFGIGEKSFHKHYNRKNENIIDGYQEAPENYYKFTKEWLQQRYRTLKPNGVEVVIMGHTNLRDVLNAAEDCGFYLFNHVIWQYNFGVYTKHKFVTSHYHLLMYKKSKHAKITFNRNCRYNSNDKDGNNGSLQYQDMEDVWHIKREFARNKIKNSNKLPSELIKKIIMYLSNQDDVISDFFLGNFTTAKAALELGRQFVGFEINRQAYDYHIKDIK